MLLLREPPANGNFMLAAYVIVAVVLLGYSVDADAAGEQPRKSVNSER